MRHRGPNEGTRAGTHTFTYNAALQPQTETITGSFYAGPIVITQSYEDGTGGTVAGRFAGYAVSQGGTPVYAATYGYDAIGRLARVTGPGLPAGTGTDYGAHYAYLPQTTLVGQVDIQDESANVRLRTVRAYEPNRDLIDYVENVWRPNGTPATISKYDYTSDTLGRRTNVEYSGVAFGSPTPPIGQPFGYNDRNELTTSSRGTASWGYVYDPMGNRKTYTTAGPVTTTYTSNTLNQYERWDRPGGAGVLARQRYTYDADGNLVQTWVAGDMNCDGVVNTTDINLFQAAILMGKTWWEATYPNCPYLNGDINGDGNVDFGDINPFSLLMAAGNAAADQTFVWDAETRLVRVEPTPGQYSPPPDGAKKVEFGYDYLGRRVLKRVWTWQAGSPGEWVLTDVRKFVWSGWLMLLELDGLAGNVALRKYTWGLDLAGLSGQHEPGAPATGHAGLPPRRTGSGAALQGLAGVGGLLAVKAPGAGPAGGDLNAAYTYDANGNVGQLVAWATGFGGAQGDEWHVDRLIAHYEYDPYGGVTAQAGTYAAANPVRFSTKYWDDETDLGYWGYRYYSPALGRWISRDPIGELGGANVYAYGGNNPSSHVDSLGLNACPKWPPHGPPVHPPYPEPDGPRVGGRGPDKSPTAQPPAPPPSKPTNSWTAPYWPIHPGPGTAPPDDCQIQNCRQEGWFGHEYIRWTGAYGRIEGSAGWHPGGWLSPDWTDRANNPPVHCEWLERSVIGFIEHGQATGSTCGNASCEEIKNCLINFKPSRNRTYDALTYNCWHGARDARNACCLSW